MSSTFMKKFQGTFYLAVCPFLEYRLRDKYGFWADRCLVNFVGSDKRICFPGGKWLPYKRFMLYYKVNHAI